MGHCITAIVLKGNIDAQIAEKYDLRGIELGSGLRLYFVDHNYSAVWQHRLESEGYLATDADYVLFPKERVLARMARDVTGEADPDFAILATDYFGGVGKQWAQLYRGDSTLGSCGTINDALKALGVRRLDGMDEFETVELDKIRSQPSHLELYADLAEALNL